jgi:hypothetical protein
MKARKIRENSPEREITAQPKELGSELATAEPAEEGLSIDPEDMGKSFIRYATEQGNFESSAQRELAITGESASDAALQGAHFSDEGTIWETTVDLSLERNTADGSADGSPAISDSDEEPERGISEIDLTESAIDEASLLDEEADVLGEVIEPAPTTEDSGTHGKPRGGHARRR